MIRTFLRGALAALVVTLAACGGGSDTCVDIAGGTACGQTGGGGGGGGVVTPVAADLDLRVSSATLPNDGSQTAVVTVTALDANRNALPGAPVTLSIDNGGILTPSGTVTDGAGIVTATVGIGADSTNRTLTVSAVSGSTTRTGTIEVRDAVLGGGGSGPTVTLSLSSSAITPVAPATLTATVRSEAGEPIAGVVVALATARGNLATLGVPSVLTNAQGIGTTTLSAATAGLSGADQITAAATIGSTSISGSLGFTVSGAAPTLQLNAASSTLRASAGPVALTATLLNAAGQVVSNQVVSFSSAQGAVSFSAQSVLTNAAGAATVTMTPTDGAATSADTVTAASTVDGQAVSSTVALQIVGEVGTAGMTLSSSDIRTGAPATVRVTVRDALNVAVPGAVVSFGSQFGLASFDNATALTDASGVASVVASPQSAATSGADVIIATVTVNGVELTAQASAQFSGSTPAGRPVLEALLSATSISAASPATVTATLNDSSGNPVPGQVVSFNVVRGLAQTNVPTALTDAAGRAVVVLSPASASSAGADEVTASASYAGVSLQATRGFQVQATNVTIDSFEAAALGGGTLSAYGQTPLTLTLTGASVTSPVNINVSSSCVALGKATLSPSSFTTTASTVTLQYRDDGCGALQSADQLQAVVVGTATSRSLSVGIDAPAESSLAFVSASPEQIFLKGSGFTESSIVTFEVRDAAGNQLPGKVVELRLLTGAGGVTMEGLSVGAPDPFLQTSNALGQVAVRVNSGTLPTPVRIRAQIQGTTIATVSSNLSVAVGLPSQLNFSMSQGTRNIEGYNIDGTPNTYQIIAADRSGNPVPDGTSVNFVTEGGQVEAIRQTQVVDGIARTTASFVSAEPRPVDGRVTVTAYALGEESFIDQNGNNTYDLGEPFQDLGNIFKDRNYDGLYDVSVDEFIPLEIDNGMDCVGPGSDLLRLDASIPSVSQDSGKVPGSVPTGTCDGKFSDAGRVYVRRALETVLSTSAGRPLWANVGAGTVGLDASCSKIDMQVGPDPTDTARFTLVAGDTWYGGSSGTLSFIVGDANPGRDVAPFPILLPRLNPMAAGTVITASTPTQGLAVTVGGGTPVASTTEATATTVAYSFNDGGTSGVVFVNFTSPSGTSTTVAVGLQVGARPTACPVP